MPGIAEDVLDFRFANARYWFIADADFDAKIRTQFCPSATAATNDELDAWTFTPPGWLALLILLDQFRATFTATMRCLGAG